MLTVLTCCVALANATVYAPADASRAERFANPPARARILPIHHHRPNDLVKADAELRELKEQGFGGLAGNVRFDEDYLRNGDSWKTWRHVVRTAHDMGMALWLYDEKGYPSATAGGLTLEGHPEWQARAYLVSVTNEPNGALRVTSIRDSYIREGTHVESSVSRYKYAYPNLLMREPTDRFIALTHDAYARELGETLAYVDSTFTDEPSLMTLWMKPMPELCLPISDELLAAYAAQWGHPLKDDIPALVSDVSDGPTAAVKHRYWTMVGERVSRNYTGRLTAWATAHGIRSGGHLLAEEGMLWHVPLYGDFFRVLRGLSAPSCDVLTSVPEQVPALTPLLAGSAGALNGATRVMSEASDHCQQYRGTGDTRPKVQVTVRQIVGSLNRQIWGGVDTFTSYYRWGAFSDEEKRAINEEIGRTVTLVSEGWNAAEIAVLYPADALMTGFAPQKRGGGGTHAKRIAVAFKQAVNELYAEGRPCMIVDAASLAQAEVRDGALVYAPRGDVRGPLRWRTVVLPCATTLPLAAVRKLAALEKAGGQVVALGARPVNSERAFPCAEVTALSEQWTQIPDEKPGALAEVIARRLLPCVEVVRGRREAVRVAHRRTAHDGEVFFVMNDSSAPWQGAVKVGAAPAVRVWNPRTGGMAEAQGQVALELPPYGGVVLTACGGAPAR